MRPRVFHRSVARIALVATFDKLPRNTISMIQRCYTSCVLVLALSWSTNTTAQQWTVDNSPNSPGQFTSLQDAINAAGAGDTLLITGTNISYGTVTVDRPLTLIGAGYNPNVLETLVDQVTVISSDVFITGLHGGIQLNVGGASGDSLANITITRCRIGNPGSLGFVSSAQAGAVERFSDIAIYNNVVAGIGFADGCFVSNVMLFDTILYVNNISGRFSSTGQCLPTFQGTETFIIDHNLFIGPSGPCIGGFNQDCGLFIDQYGVPIWDNSTAIISNNIFHFQEVGGIRGCGQCSWFNNITCCTGTNDTIPGTPPGNQNQWGVNPQLINYPGGTFNWSHDYSLQPGSPALGTGTFGTDIGPFDGPYPFNLGAPPQGPYIEYFNVDGSAIEINGDVIINFKAYVRP